MLNARYKYKCCRGRVQTNCTSWNVEISYSRIARISAAWSLEVSMGNFAVPFSLLELPTFYSNLEVPSCSFMCISVLIECTRHE